MIIGSDVFDLIKRIAAVTTAHGAWDAYLAAAKHAGFRFGLACSTSPAVPLRERVIGLEMPDGWLDYYQRQDYAPHNPLAARGRESIRAFEWRPTDWDAKATQHVCRWRDDNLAAGMVYGISVPDTSAGTRSVVTLAAEHNEIHPSDRMALHFAGVELLFRMRELGAHPTTHVTSGLSARECECLKWVSAGKTDWEIGEILNLSEKTVNAYIERAKHKLHVQNRTQAVMTALREGVISL